MKKEILVFLPSNYGDWEGAYVCAELNKPETEYSIKTLAIDKQPVKSMGGFTILPDYSLQNLPDSFAMLILIGGLSWQSDENDAIKAVVDICVDKKIPVAAICDACTFLANKGYLDHREHTGNTAAYMTQCAPGYKGAEYFCEKQVACAEGFITANGTAALEFSKEILRYLQVMSNDALENSYQMFKVGFYKD